jgi:hypothetical protein
LTYLIPVFHKDKEFLDRSETLFGAAQTQVSSRTHSLKMVESSSNCEPFVSFSLNSDWKKLTQRFRQRVVQHMRSHEEQYVRFVASDHGEDYNASTLVTILIRQVEETLGWETLKFTQQAIPCFVRSNKTVHLSNFRAVMVTYRGLALNCCT